MATEYAFVDDSGLTRFEGFLQPDPAGASALVVDVTSDPDTFLFTWEHDFGQMVPLFVAITVVALTPDGETFGPGMGDIQVAVGNAAGNNTFEGQRDALPDVPGWQVLTPSFANFSGNVNDAFDSLSDYADFTYVVPQCIRIKQVAWGIVDNNGDPYAGANHPTATIRLSLEYLT